MFANNAHPEICLRPTASGLQPTACAARLDRARTTAPVVATLNLRSWLRPRPRWEIQASPSPEPPAPSPGAQFCEDLACDVAARVSAWSRAESRSRGSHDSTSHHRVTAAAALRTSFPGAVGFGPAWSCEGSIVRGVGRAEQEKRPQVPADGQVHDACDSEACPGRLSRLVGECFDAEVLPAMESAC